MKTLIHDNISKLIEAQASEFFDKNINSENSIFNSNNIDDGTFITAMYSLLLLKNNHVETKELKTFINSYKQYIGIPLDKIKRDIIFKIYDDYLKIF